MRLNDSSFLQRPQFALADIEPIAKYFGVAFSQPAAQVLNCSRRFGQARNDPWDREIANALVRDPSQRVPHPKLFFGKDFGDAVDRPAGDIAVTAEPDHLIAVKL